jgi:hypothetical protein
MGTTAAGTWVALACPRMKGLDRIPMVRCRLDGSQEFADLRYVPLAEFGLWQYLMETKHRRRVAVEQVSVWVAEDAASWDTAADDEDDLEPVLRVCFDRPLGLGLVVPVERYFPAETYPEAQHALLRHFEGVGPERVRATPGYFVPVRSGHRVATPAV